MCKIKRDENHRNQINWMDTKTAETRWSSHSKYGENFNFMCKNDILAIVPTQFVSGALF